MDAGHGRRIVESIESEYRRYESLGRRALDQLEDAQLVEAVPGSPNSVAVVVWHVSGNLRSRFTDFLTSDGEKPWRDRESEFESRPVSRAELLEKWEDGWRALHAALATLADVDLARSVSIRGVPLGVDAALQRSLAHTSYHVGQLVLLARILRGADWAFLSIPPGKSSEYNRDPTLEKPPSKPTS